MWPDLINASVELGGAYFTWRNYSELRQARELRGVYWPTIAFFTLWGIWNLVYYPAIGQWLSFAAGILLAAGNLAWVVLAIRLRLDKAIEEVFDEL